MQLQLTMPFASEDISVQAHLHLKILLAKELSFLLFRLIVLVAVLELWKRYDYLKRPFMYIVALSVVCQLMQI